MEMTQHEQQAAALHKEWEKHHFGDINDMIAFAAFCLEKQGWKKYPEEKPETKDRFNNFLVAVKFEDNFLYVQDVWTVNGWYKNERLVVAFMPISEFKPTSP